MTQNNLVLEQVQGLNCGKNLSNWTAVKKKKVLYMDIKTWIKIAWPVTLYNCVYMHVLWMSQDDWCVMAVYNFKTIMLID